MQAARGASLTAARATEGAVEHRSRRRRTLTLFGLVAAGVFALDQSTKLWAVHSLQGKPPKQVVGDLLRLDLVRNPGAAFSTGTSYTVVLTCVAVAAVVTVLWVSRRLASTLWAAGLGLLLGGVLGNLTDRLFREPSFMRGHVVDFLRLPHWPVFNVADMCIDLAAAVIVLQAVRGVSLTGQRTGQDAGQDAGQDSGHDSGEGSSS